MKREKSKAKRKHRAILIILLNKIINSIANMHNKWIFFLKMFIDGLGFRDMLIANINEFTNTLDKEQGTALPYLNTYRNKLKGFLKMLIEGLGFKDMLLENIREFDTNLTQTQE